jgi:hypothetical protein
MSYVRTRIQDETLEDTLKAMAARVGVTPERMLQIAISNQKHIFDLRERGGEFAVKFRSGGPKRINFF